MKDTDFLMKAQDGVEFFTHKITGESAVSVKGLARMAGVAPKQVRGMVGIDGGAKGAKKLETLDDIKVLVEAQIFKRGKEITPITSDAATEVLIHCAHVLHKPEAKRSVAAFLRIGLESYIQGVTGYLPEKYQASTQDARYQITRLVKEPNPWKLLYSREVCDRVRSWYFPRDFFWKFAYSWMTPQEVEFLNEHNPVIEGIWQRRDRIFQFLSDETRDRLAPEIAALCLLIETSTSRQDFETRYNRKHGADQKELINV
jgi:hypothetical protein